jgi:tRNA (cmo5U34)-methyltransferase
MSEPYEHKSTTEEIRRRFDADVERFSNLQTGQSATLDAPLVMDLVTSAAARVTPHAASVLDIGCGAGNYVLKLLEQLPGLSVTLVDLSRPMLDRARERLAAAGARQITLLEGDIRQTDLETGSFDIVMAAASLHHLRGEEEWRDVFTKVFRVLRPGGSFWIADLVSHDVPVIQQMMWDRYGEYLVGLGGIEYRDKVFAYVEQEDTPRSCIFQLELLRQVGFSCCEILHKNGCFSAFGAIKSL